MDRTGANPSVIENQVESMIGNCSKQLEHDHEPSIPREVGRKTGERAQ
jgi:hypothetical protein